MRKAAFHFCEDRNVSARVHEICLLTTTLLDVFFDVLLTDGGSKCLIDIIPAIFTRSGLLWGPINFQGRVRRILVDRCIACFNKRPEMLAIHLRSIIEIMMSSHGPMNSQHGVHGLSELALNMCWIVGERKFFKKKRKKKRKKN